MTTPPPDQPILGSVTQLLGGGGPLGGLTSGLGTLTGSNTTTYDVPTVSVQTHATPEAKTAPAPAPAKTTLATTTTDTAADTSAHTMSATPDAELAATSGPASAPTGGAAAPTMTTTSSVSSSSAAECACNLTMGTPPRR